MRGKVQDQPQVDWGVQQVPAEGRPQVQPQGQEDGSSQGEDRINTMAQQGEVLDDLLAEKCLQPGGGQDQDHLQGG